MRRDCRPSPKACGERKAVRAVRRCALAALALVLAVALSVATAGIAVARNVHRRMTPLQVADFALKCARENKISKITTYFDIRCAAIQSTNISVVTGIVGGPTEFPAYSTIGFLFDQITKQYTCYAYPDKVGAQPVNVTSDCPLWIIPSEFSKTNFPSAFAIASTFTLGAAAPVPTLAQVQSVAGEALGNPTVSIGSGSPYRNGINPELTLRLTYSSGIGRHWCLWFYQQSGSGGQPQAASLVSPPGMYGTC